LTIFTLISAASATPQAAEEKKPTPAMVGAQTVVQGALVEPLSGKEGRRRRFSRAFLPPMARRVRILDESLRKDDKGAGFVTFAIDSRHGWMPDTEEASWRLKDITGCVYPDSREVFVVRGTSHFPAALLLGKRVKAAAAHVCRVDSASGAQAMAR
jgi:hypothetical protein